MANRRMSSSPVRLLLLNVCVCSFASSLSSVVAPSKSLKPQPTEQQHLQEIPSIGAPSQTALSLDDLHNWADAHGIQRKAKVEQEFMAGGGRGLVATERIEADEVIIKVPLSAVVRLTADAKLDEDDEWAGILAKKLWEESCFGLDSAWAAYINNLPTEAPLTPCRWNSAQRQSLQSEAFVRSVQENSAWRIRQVKQQNIPNQHRIQYLQFLDLVCSRTVKGRDGSRQLVPLIDVANHEPSEAGGGHFYVDQQAVYLLAGNRGVNAGQAVTLDYGGRSVDDFLLHYGFVPHRCFSDSVKISIVPTTGSNDITNNQEIATVSWQSCQGYQGHADEQIREACSSVISSFPTTIDEDVMELNKLSSNDDDLSSGGVSSAAATAKEAEHLALNYRYAKKSLLASAVGMDKAVTAYRSAFAAQ